jgi:Large ribosomal RNA subunit accumulation protein YceD
MTPESVGPFSRPVSVRHLPPEGLDVAVEATPEERLALAKDFRLEAIHALEGRFRLAGTAEQVRVTGVVNARVSQICVVTLEPFDDAIEEQVEVDFASGGALMPEGGVVDEPADEISGGQIDLGALAAEFLALGLDPYPRKPGADFAYDGKDEGPASPFAALKALKPES